MKDYYKILEVSPTATSEEIKKSYRKLALKYHASRNSGNKDSESTFKLIVEACQILIDKEARAEYDFKYFQKQQPSNRNYQRSETESTSVSVTPLTFLVKLQNIRKSIQGISRSKINHRNLYDSIIELYTEANIKFLIHQGNPNIIRQIIEETLKCSKPLGVKLHPVQSFKYIDSITIKLVILAGFDNESRKRIFSFSQYQKYRGYWDQYKRIVIAVLIAFIIFLNLYLQNNHNTRPQNSSTRSDGDLNNSFTEKIPKSEPDKELTPEERIAEEKTKLFSEGWEEKVIKNGQLPSCYNFVPQKGVEDNYLKVHVGSGTDVAIKVMNLDTEKCIRFVFINSGSTYSIRKIPEGQYYLKLAYGKDWLSKVENGQCIGKFLRNPSYEKGDQILDFRIKHISNERYQVPSFELKLDVTSSPSMNTFDSRKISEGAFNN